MWNTYVTLQSVMSFRPHQILEWRCSRIHNWILDYGIDSVHMLLFSCRSSPSKVIFNSDFNLLSLDSYFASSICEFLGRRRSRNYCNHHLQSSSCQTFERVGSWNDDVPGTLSPPKSHQVWQALEWRRSRVLYITNSEFSSQISCHVQHTFNTTLPTSMNSDWPIGMVERHQ